MTLSRFERIANRLILAVYNGDIEDLEHDVDIDDYYDELADDDEAIIAAEEYAYTVLGAVGG